MLDFGILGNNARNLNYIKKFNDKKAIRLANDKLQTKHFLSERGIPFATTYGIIKNRKELMNFNFSSLAKKEFVVKPNQGSKGQGIYIVKSIKTKANNKDENNSIEHKYQTGGNIVSESEFKRYLVDILNGKFSLNILNDKIIVEEKLIAGESFKDFCKHGLADIRIIVFNLVPVIAMIRVPTKESGGKANLAQGGLGFGIDMGTGKVKSMLRKGRILTSNFPGEYSKLEGKRIPYRSDLMFLSSKVQFFVNLGYLALDWVITDDGPKLLEINARAGLEVQNVSNQKLKRTLERISDLKIPDPEKGVEIAQSLFTSSKNNPNAGKVLYLTQNGKLVFKSKGAENEIDVIVEVSLNQKDNYVNSDIYQKSQGDNKGKFTLYLDDEEIVLADIKLKANEEIKENRIIIGKETASNYLIKPMHKIFEQVNVIKPDKLLKSETDQLHIIDERIDKISKKLILTNRLRPVNYFEELDTFITLNGKYDPQFKYKRSLSNKNDIEVELNEIKKTLLSPDIKSEFKNLFLEKIEELFDRYYLLTAYKNQDFENILKYNIKLFGDFDEEILKISKEKVFENSHYDTEILGRPISKEEIESCIESHLLEKGIYGVDIISSYTNLSRISVVMGKKIKINIGEGAIFREREFESILAHEVDTHLIRYINGMKSDRKILKNGTGYYLKDEEGFAIRNASQVLPEDYEKLSIYKKYFLTKEAQYYSFSKLIDLIKFMYPERSLEGTFKTAIKLKKGIEDTSVINAGAISMKEKVYLDGYYKILRNIEKGEKLDRLIKGKIKVEDMDYII